MAYIPFDATEEEIAQKSIIRDGIPSILAAPLKLWLIGMVSNRNSYVDHALGIALQLELDWDFGLTATSGLSAANFADVAEERGPEGLMRVIDCIMHLSERLEYGDIQLVSEALDKYRSKYCVVRRDGRWRIGFRVPEGLEETMQEAINAADATAGKLLAEAWEYAFGLDGKAEEAMDKAVKAVESAATPIVCRNHPAASLGNVIADVKQQGNWTLGLRSNASAYPGVTLHHMLQSLWHGQQYRHVDKHAILPTIEQARVHVMLAATLVGWFSSGQVVQDNALPQPKNWANLQP